MKLETGNSASIITFKGIMPRIHPSAFLCEGVRIIGDVEIGKDCSIWYNTVIRGDVHYIKIGEGVNVQDLSMLHVTNDRFPLNIGNFVSIGHSASIHGSTIHDYSLIGIGATVLDGSVINSNSLVAAGSLVREGYVVPAGVLVAGVPAKIMRDLTDDELIRVKETASNYIKYTQEYRMSL
jgi:gamma-carbonic anhydrase